MLFTTGGVVLTLTLVASAACLFQVIIDSFDDTNLVFSNLVITVMIIVVFWYSPSLTQTLFSAPQHDGQEWNDAVQLWSGQKKGQGTHRLAFHQTILIISSSYHPPTTITSMLDDFLLLWPRLEVISDSASLTAPTPTSSFFFSSILHDHHHHHCCFHNYDHQRRSARLLDFVLKVLRVFFWFFFGFASDSF